MQRADASYNRLAGEVEARAVEEQLERQDWTTPIWQHDAYIPFQHQIVRMPGRGGQEASFRLTPVDHNPFEEGSSP
jgi:hypothetical protein